MATMKEQLDTISELMENAEGYFTDAEFRDDMDVKIVRYYQSMSSSLRALCLQNTIVIELLAKQSGEWTEA